MSEEWLHCQIWSPEWDPNCISIKMPKNCSRVYNIMDSRYKNRHKAISLLPFQRPVQKRLPSPKLMFPFLFPSYKPHNLHMQTVQNFTKVIWWRQQNLITLGDEVGYINHTLGPIKTKVSTILFTKVTRHKNLSLSCRN